MEGGEFNSLDYTGLTSLKIWYSKYNKKQSNVP